MKEIERTLRAIVGTLCITLLTVVVAGCAEPEVPIPFPDVSKLDPQVGAELDEARRSLQARLDKPGRTRADHGVSYGEAGMIYHAHGQLATAIACYENARNLAPTDFRWAYYLGHARRAAGDPSGAAAAFEDGLVLRPADVPTLVQLGRIDAERQETEHAESLFRRALALDSLCVPALVGLGKIALDGKDYDAAVEHLERARGIMPSATEIHYPLGLAYRGIGRAEDALELLEQRGEIRAEVADPLMDALRAKTRGWTAHMNRGTVLAGEGLLREAVAEFRKAAGYEPDEPDVFTNLGFALTRLGDQDGAREAFEQALQRDPAHVMAHYNLGTILARQGDDAAAVEHYKAVLRVDPGRLDARFNLGNALRRLGRFDEAAPLYRAVVEGDTGNAAARLAEALTLIRLGRHVEARQRLEQALGAIPDDRPLRQVLARLLAASPEDGVRAGQRALDMAKELMATQRSLAVVATLAMAAAETGDFATALRWQTAAIEAARKGGREDLLLGLEENLRDYQRGRPCRRPWRDDDPVLAPPPLSDRQSPAL